MCVLESHKGGALRVMGSVKSEVGRAKRMLGKAKWIMGISKKMTEDLRTSLA